LRLGEEGNLVREQDFRKMTKKPAKKIIWEGKIKEQWSWGRGI